MVYIAFVNLFHTICCFAFSCLSLFFSGNALLRKNVLKKSASISPTLVVYFIFILIWAILMFVYTAYLITKWGPDGGSYNAYILYFAGFGPSISLTANSIAESFLCIERSISLLFPLRYTAKQQMLFAWLTAFGIFLITLITFFMNRYTEGFPAVAETPCQHFACLLGDRYLFYVKISLNIVNIFFAIILAILIKKTLTTSNKKTKVINRTMVILISLTTTIELVPFFIGQIFLSVNFF